MFLRAAVRPFRSRFVIPLLALAAVAGTSAQQPDASASAPPQIQSLNVGPGPVQPGDVQSGNLARTLQDGTPVKLRLVRAISSADAKEGDEIPFEVADAITIAGVTILRSGAPATGVVTRAAARRRMGRAGELSFTVRSVGLADGESVPLRATNDSRGDSRVTGITALMVSGVPMVAAPFMLLVKGGDSSIAKGALVTAFVDRDFAVDLTKFAGPDNRQKVPAR